MPPADDPRPQRPGRDARGRFLPGCETDDRCNRRRYPRRRGFQYRARFVRCRQCGRVFSTRSWKAKFCSKACAARFYAPPKKGPRGAPRLTKAECALLEIVERPHRQTFQWWLRTPGFGLVIPLSAALAEALHQAFPLLQEVSRRDDQVGGVDDVPPMMVVLHDILLGALRRERERARTTPTAAGRSADPAPQEGTNGQGVS